MPASEFIALALVVAGVLAAVVFTAVPLVPGAPFLLLGAVGYGLLAGWAPFTWYFWVGQALLTMLYLLVDNVAQYYGMRRAGGSRAAVVGASIGVVVGPFAFAFLGPLALVVGPIAGAAAGAVIGEHYSERDSGATLRAARGAVLSFVVGTAAKFAILGIQVGWLAWVLIRS